MAQMKGLLGHAQDREAMLEEHTSLYPSASTYVAAFGPPDWQGAEQLARSMLFQRTFVGVETVRHDHIQLRLHLGLFASGVWCKHYTSSLKTTLRGRTLLSGRAALDDCNVRLRHGSGPECLCSEHH